MHFYCHYCLLSYHTKQALSDHETLCRRKLQRLEPPKSSQVIEFRNFCSLFYLPFIIFFDIEAMLKREGDRQVHQPISVCTFTVSQHEENMEQPHVFTGENCIQFFLDHLEIESRRIEDILNSVNEPIRTNAADKERYERTTRCDICRTTLRDQRKCRDHDHLSMSSESNLRYITCSLCNLTYGSNKLNKIPIVVHNSMSYDINYIISKLENASNVRILAKNTERPLTLRMKGNLVFIDSLNFLSGSLDHLASKLPQNDLDEYLCWLTRRDARRTHLLLHKAALPYDFIDSADKLNVNNLPPIDAIYNRLTDTALSQEDSLRAQKIWLEFDCSTLKDYMEVYVTLDVLLLAAMFENYRKSTFKHFQLDPAHYVSSPSLCFDAMLLLTGVKLDVLHDTDMYLFFTKSIRGGLSGSAVRYAKANNELMADYNPDVPVSHIMSFDANNLYGHSLSNPLPMSDFEGLSRRQIDALDIESHPKNDPFGYFLEVDLEYPQSLHDTHNDFPLVPEKIEILNEELSPFMLQMKKKLHLKQKSSGLKLIATLKDKTCHILHYEILKFYLRLGLRLIRIHRCMRFKQGDFLKGYIAHKIRCRKNAKHDFEVSLFKLYNNCIYGKTIYNVFKQLHVQLVSDATKFQRLAARPTFVSSYQINE